MKKILFFLVVSIKFIIGQELQSFLSTATFHTEEGSFLETYLSFNASTLTLIKEKDKYTGKVDIKITIKEHESIIFKDHYVLNSPLFDQISNNMIFFIDQQRIPLNNGIYNIEILISDIYSTLTDTLRDNVILNYNNISISDIQLIESYTISESDNILTKSGYKLLPFISNFYPSKVNELIYYVELYNTDLLSDSRYIFNSYIETLETKAALFDYNKIYRKNSSIIESNILTFDIKNLPTGNYNLVCEIRNSINELLVTKKKFFQRSNNHSEITNYNDLNTIDLKGTFLNNISNIDTLRKFIDYLYPISTPQENTFAQNQLNYNDIQLMKKFFLNFWKSRDFKNPELAWARYLNKVNSVNNTFRYFKIEGYLTDRGRVYLQYGSPNSRHLEVDSKDNKPYEIWHYYNLGRYTNKKFVFIDNNRTGEYKLEFSNVDGEESNLEWMQDVDYNQNRNSDFRDNYINPR